MKARLLRARSTPSPIQVHRRAPECYGTRRDKRHSRTPLTTMRFSLRRGVGFRAELAEPSTMTTCVNAARVRSTFPSELFANYRAAILKTFEKENFSDSFNRAFRRNRRRWHWIECCFEKNRYKAVWKLFPRSHYGIAAT